MVRPRKRRRVCGMPEVEEFGPINSSKKTDDIIIMTVEEYESIRLIDLEELTQSECADAMDVARSTVQRIYNDARRKLADSLINAKVLKIEGGAYKICSNFSNEEDDKGCFCSRNRHRGGRRV